MHRSLRIALIVTVFMGSPAYGSAPDARSRAVPEGAPPSVGTADAIQRGEALEISPGDEIEGLRRELEVLRRRMDLLEESLAASARSRHVAALPTHVDFAGAPVPLDRWGVRERLEREFFLALGDGGQVVLWLKRSTRYFPYIEAELARAGLPADLKYVAVVESALLPTAYSRASALGIWQFTAATAQRYGLTLTPWWDERRNPESSTTAALAYLRDLDTRFHDWPLALAGYNAGEPRVGQALTQQGVASFYQLALPDETERYVLRVIAAKLILSEPDRYGFQVPDERRYQPYATDLVPVYLPDRMLVTELAKAAGSFYRELKLLNPEIVEEVLPAGSYRLHVPQGHGAALTANLAAREPHLAASSPPPTPYRVQRGDTLMGIARRFGVSLDRLRSFNHALVQHGLPVGATLLIPRGSGP